MMEDCCAPQWTDFTCSPQLPSDSFFEVEHECHEKQGILKFSKYQGPRKADVSMDSLEDDAKSINDSIESKEAAPKVAFFVTLDEEEETANISTIGDLPEAMKNLQICAKARKPNLSRKKTLIKKEEGGASTSGKSGKTVRHANINSTICGNFPSKYLEENASVKAEDANKTLPKTITFEITQSPKEIECQMINKRLSYKIIRRRESNSFRSKRNSLGKSGPRFLTSQFRRRSLTKGRRRSNQFVSFAEAVSKFHSGTPDRFRTVCHKDLKPAAVMKLRKAPLKLTMPISPALRCKQRSRTGRVLTKEQREQQELEEMKKHQIKANPIPANLLKAPAPLKKVEKKPTTITEEFKLTQSHRQAPLKKEEPKPSTTLFKKEIVHPEKSQKPSTEESRNTKLHRRTMMPLMNTKQAPMKKDEITTFIPLPKKDTNSWIPERAQTVPNKIRLTPQKHTRHTTSAIPSPCRPLDKKEEHKVSSSSIATTSSTHSYSKVTRSVPTAFDARTKEFLERKEQKMKSLQTQVSSKNKAEFHARPVPKFSKPRVAPKEQAHKKPVVALCPFSFEERDKNLAKKKEQQVKQILEEREKHHQFHAAPVPTFKPVTVHGLPKEHSRIRDKSVDRTKKVASQTKEDQENKQPNIIAIPLTKELKPEIIDNTLKKTLANNQKLKITETNILKPKNVAVELNTDKRAKDRHGFEEKKKKKEEEEELRRQEEEKRRIAKEKMERAELRKKTEVKARPMPVYRPMLILKSDRPPTSPKSPAWASKLKSKNVP